MCGRYTSTTPAEVLASAFAVDEVTVEALEPRWNVAPTLDVPVVATRSSGARVLGTMRWGLVPSWAKDASGGARMINARAEGLATKPAFRSALARRRCLVPADAFYEWQALEPGPDGKKRGKLPWAIRRRDHAPMAFAGLWEVWRDPASPDTDPLRTCTIVTTSANGVLAPIHARMPVVLGPDGWQRWLDPAVPVDEASQLLVPAPDEWFEAFPVSTLVNKVAVDGPELLEPLPAPPSGELPPAPPEGALPL